MGVIDTIRGMIGAFKAYLAPEEPSRPTANTNDWIIGNENAKLQYDKNGRRYLLTASGKVVYLDAKVEELEPEPDLEPYDLADEMPPKEKKKRSPLDGYKTYDVKDGYGSAEEWSSAFNERMNFDQAVDHIKSDSPLAILGLATTPTVLELKRRYRELMKEHQDSFRADASTKDQEVVQKIIAAYTVLLKQIS